MLGGTVGQACDEDRGQHPAGGEGRRGKRGVMRTGPAPCRRGGEEGRDEETCDCEKWGE